MNLVRHSLHVLAAAFLVACATAEPGPPLVPAAGPPASTAMRITGPGCAFGVHDVKVSIENVSSGVIVTFVVPVWGNVDELRERVKSVAAQHGPGAHMGPGHNGEHDTGDHHGFHFSEMPPVDTSFQLIDGGARLHVLATDSTDVLAVQRQMLSRVENVAAGACR